MPAPCPPPTAAPPCPAAALARLGPLLCLSRALEPHVLAGWSLARRVQPRICVDAEGPREALCFHAADGRLCWQLYLLPDSDWLAWDELVARLLAGAIQPPSLPPVAPCPWAIRLGIGEPLWRACALRLHALPGDELAASQARLSRAGSDAALRIAARAVGTSALAI